jgi:hypothetical protein
MNQRLKKTAVALALLGVSATVAWASCGETADLVNADAGIRAKDATASLAAAATQLISIDNTETSVILSALKILSKQIDSSTEKTAATTVSAELSMAAVAKEIADKEMIDKIVLDYTSQGFDPCAQSAATRRMANAEVEAAASVPGRIGREVEAGGGRLASAADALRTREERHQALFCTQAEVDSGACSSVGKIPGGDTNAALLFNSDTSKDMVAAKNAVINNIVGLPDSPVSREAANTPEAMTYLMEKKRKDAFLAWPIYSLKTIQTENETFRPAMDARVGQYFGTQQAMEWAKSQASQAPRGLLVDLVKIQGLSLKLAERRLKQNMRLEANLAAMLELENQQQHAVAIAATPK